LSSSPLSQGFVEVLAATQTPDDKTWCAHLTPLFFASLLLPLPCATRGKVPFLVDFCQGFRPSGCGVAVGGSVWGAGFKELRTR
jgi:hypothetical protein